MVDAMVQEYMEYLSSVRNLSSNTLIAYGKDLAQFVAYGKANGLKWSTLTKQDVDGWMGAMNAQGLKPRTIKRRVSSVRSLCRWMVTEGMREGNPVRYCQTPKAGEQLPKVADMAGVTAYLKSQARTEHGRMMHALVALLIETGIRLQEALDITFEDVDRAKRSILIHGKGNKERRVYYGSETARQVNAYAQGRKHGRVFAMSDQWAVRKLMTQEVGRFCPRIHPHSLRHTFACAMLANGCDIKTLSAILGHESVQTTEIYAQVHPRQQELAFKKYSPTTNNK